MQERRRKLERLDTLISDVVIRQPQETQIGGSLQQTEERIDLVLPDVPLREVKSYQAVCSKFFESN